MLPCRSGDSAGLSLHWFCRSLSLLPNYESFIYQCMKLVLWSGKLYRTHPSSTLSYNCILQASCIHTRAVFPSLVLWTLLKAECICVVIYKDYGFHQNIPRLICFKNIQQSTIHPELGGVFSLQLKPCLSSFRPGTASLTSPPGWSTDAAVSA